MKNKKKTAKGRPKNKTVLGKLPAEKKTKKSSI